MRNMKNLERNVLKKLNIPADNILGGNCYSSKYKCRYVFYFYTYKIFNGQGACIFTHSSVHPEDISTKFFILNNAASPCNGICYDIQKGFLPQSFSEVKGGVVFMDITKSESTEIGEFWHIFKFSFQVSFRGGITQINEKESLEDAHKIITLSSQSMVLVVTFNKDTDKEEINGFTDGLHGIVRFYGFWNKVINKMWSSCLVLKMGVMSI